MTRQAKARLLRSAALSVSVALLGLAWPAVGQTVSLLPNGQQQFLDANGSPLGGGTVKLCVPNTSCTQLTSSWSDPQQANLNSNPVLLDSAGRATIYGSGQIEEILFDALGNQVWDKLTFGINPSSQVLLANLPAGSVLGNSGSASGPASGLALLPPLAASSAGVTSSKLVTVDGTGANVGLTSADNGHVHAVGSNQTIYNLPPVASVGNGFYLQVVAGGASAILVPHPAEAFLGSTPGGPLTLLQGQVDLVFTDGSQWYSSISSSSQPSYHYPGQVVLLRGPSCPAGTLPEDGRTLSRSAYSALFLAIGGFWGPGDGTTTFQIPNAGGRFNRGFVPGQVQDANRGFGTYQSDSLQQFGVTTPVPNTGNNAGGGAGQAFQAPFTSPIAGTITGSPRFDVETRPINITALSCIVTGLLP